MVKDDFVMKKNNISSLVILIKKGWEPQELKNLGNLGTQKIADV